MRLKYHESTKIIGSRFLYGFLILLSLINIKDVFEKEPTASSQNKITECQNVL